MNWAIILGLSGVALYLGMSLHGARARIAELVVLNDRLKRRLARGNS
jgi:hypothetical protein